MKALITILLLSLATFACKSKSDAAPPPANAVDPVAQPVANAPLLGPGESFVELDKHAPNPIEWSVANQKIQLGLVARAGSAHVRVYLGNRRIDLAETFHVDNDTTWELAVTPDATAVDLSSRRLAGRAPEVGALFAVQARLISWDAAHAEPTVANRWTCDETTAKQGCDAGPPWRAAPQVAANVDDKEVPSDRCCCEATFVDPKTNREKLMHDVMSADACQRKTDDGKCVAMTMCKITK